MSESQIKSTRRADVALVASGLARSRGHASELIAAGHAMVNGAVVKKPSQEIAHDAELATTPGGDETYVSRGGHKLAGALDRIHYSVDGLRVLDVGVSTGGFADCCLRRGAAFVLGIDVGRGQLSPTLRGHPRLRTLEGINARDLASDELRSQIESETGGEGFDLIVVDVSFISLTLVLPAAIQYLNNRGVLLALVKPQFEAGRAAVGKGGIVRDPADHERTKGKILGFLAEAQLSLEDYFESSITGSDGNIEFFVYAKKN